MPSSSFPQDPKERGQLDWGRSTIDRVDQNLADQVRMLRQRGEAPKAIARTLGVSAAEVLGALNDSRAAAGFGDGDDEPQCWISAGWSLGLGLDGAPQWAAFAQPSANDHSTGGLACVLVARHLKHANKAQVAGFLLDVYCLGSKNTLPPEPMSPTTLAEHRQAYFGAFDSHLPIPAGLARDLVFGAVAHARSLGFEPDDDYEEAAALLGAPEHPSPIRFGRDGKPFYVNGPYDDPESVVRTLRRSVGEGNYDFTLMLSEPSRRRFRSPIR